MKHYFSMLIVVSFLVFTSLAQQQSDNQCLSQSVFSQFVFADYCSARLTGENLILENSRISRIHSWNNGNLNTQTISDKQTNNITLNRH